MGFYLGIMGAKQDLPSKDIDTLINLCYKFNSAFVNPMFLAKNITESVYINKYITLEELQEIYYKDMDKIIQEDNFGLLKNYSSKNNDYDIN